MPREFLTETLLTILIRIQLHPEITILIRDRLQTIQLGITILIRDRLQTAHPEVTILTRVQLQTIRLGAIILTRVQLLEATQE